MAALLADHRLEADDAVRQYETADAAIRREAGRLWSEHGAALGERLAAVKDEALHAYAAHADLRQGAGRATCGGP